MKQIPKKKFDSLLTMTRKLQKTHDDCFIDSKIALSQILEMNTGIDWLSFMDLVDCIFRYKGFKPNATNATVYSVLNVLGYEVVGDEDKESESM